MLVDDLDALAARLADAGAPVRWDGEFPGHRRFYSEDPHGNRLEFLSPSSVGRTRDPEAGSEPGRTGDPEAGSEPGPHRGP